MTAPTPTVTGVDFVTMPTQNLAAAREFYGTVLDLPCSAVWGRENPIGAEYETGSLTLALLDSAAVGQEFRPSTSAVALRVDDVESARAELRSRGVEFRGDIVDSGVCHQAYFADPDGNPLVLHHRYAPLPPRP